MANVSNIAELLERVQSPDGAIRNEAERLLKQLEVENYSWFLIGLCATFAAEDKPLHIQRLAVIVFKNVLDSKDHDTKETQLQRWAELDVDVKTHVRTEILRLLHHRVCTFNSHSVDDVTFQSIELARTVSMLIAKVAAADIPRGEWPELIPSLLNNMTVDSTTSSLRQATLESLGYICEELADVVAFELNQEIINSVLTAVVRGLIKEEKDDDVRLVATRALNSALEFAQTNFSNGQEQKFIMQVVCEGIMCPTSEDVRVASYECLIRICQSYYDYIPPYIDDIYRLTLHTIQSDEEIVAKQAMELWCALCEEELGFLEEMESTFLDETTCHDLIKHFYETLVPVLLTQMTKQEEDQELDETTWTLSMAAGACLELVALCVKNDIVPIVLKYCSLYLEHNENPESWRFREAATLALGSIVDGAQSQELLVYVQSTFNRLLEAMRDPDPSVRNTTAWTLGRIFEFLAFENNYVPILSGHNLDGVIRTLTAALNDEPHIANRVCFAISQLADSVARSETMSLSAYFVNLIQSLISVAFKSVSDRSMQTRLQVSAFDAINGMIRGAPDDCMKMVMQMVEVVGTKLKESMQPPSNAAPEDLEKIPDLQGMLCGCLGVVLRRLEAGGNEQQSMEIAVADVVMEILLRLFQTKNAAVHEEAMLAIGALTFTVKSQFSRYMAQFMPFLEFGLGNHRETQVCISTIGTLSNICNAISDAISPYSDPIMEMLISTLQSQEVSRDIKPHILCTFADIAMAMGIDFGKYLSVVTNILKSAVELSIAESGTIDESFAEYNNELRKGILEAYAGILQGVGQVEAERCLHQESQFMIDFLERVVSEAPRDANMVATAMGLLGDIAYFLPSLNSWIRQKKWIQQFIKECIRSPHLNVKAAVKYTEAVLSKVPPTTATSA